MRLAVKKGRMAYLGNVVGMRILCMQDVKKLVRELVLLLVCPLSSRMMFPTAPPSLMMIAWVLQFALNIQYPRENSGMMMTALSIFLNLLLHQIL